MILSRNFIARQNCVVNVNGNITDVNANPPKAHPCRSLFRVIRTVKREDSVEGVIYLFNM